MTILVEDVHGLLGVTQIGASRSDIDFLLPYRIADMQTFVDRIFTIPPTFPVIKGRRLNLAHLYFSFWQIEDSASQDQLLVCLHLLIGGLTLFVTKDFSLDVYHTEFLIGLTEHLWRSPSVAILAATYLGLTSVSTGGDFVGSPFLLSKWLQVHFPRLGPVKTDLIEERVCSLSAAPIDISAPSTSLSHKQQARGSSVELKLIGPTHFVVYNSHRCFEMVGQKKGVPPRLSFIPHIRVRERSLPSDAVTV